MGENRGVNRNLLGKWLLLLILAGALKVSAQGTAFSYQGRLNVGGVAVTNIYDFRFALYDAVINGDAIGMPQTNVAVGVTNGIFMTTIDFGPVFTGTNYWLSVGVRTNGAIGNTNTFTLLSPRQALLPVPYAIFANSASNLLGALPATQLVGTLPSAQVMGSYVGAVNFSNGANAFYGSFHGNGLNLTNLNGTMISTGTVADARLSSNVALLNTNQTFTGVNNFNNVSNNFTGSFFGNGLVGWIPIPSNTVQAVRDTGYLLLSSNLTTVMLPTNGALLTGDVIRISGAGSGGWQLGQNAGQSVVGIFLSASNSSWNPASAPAADWYSIACSADGVVMAAGAITTGVGIYISLDSGQTWSGPNTTYQPISLASTAEGTQMAGVVSGGEIVYSTNSGTTWGAIAGSTTSWTSIASSSDGSRLVATVSGGLIYTNITNPNTNYAGSFAASSATSMAWDSVASSANGINLVAVVNGGNIYTSTNGGFSWTKQAGSPKTNWVSVASSADGSKLAAAVSAGRIYTSPDYGVTWNVQTNAPANNWYHIASSADGGRLLAVVNTLGGSGGGIYVSANYGLNWVAQNVPNEDWYSATCSSDGTRMVAVYHNSSNVGGIYYWQAAAATTGSTAGVTGSVTGGPGTAVELQYIGNGQFMPISTLR